MRSSSEILRTPEHRFVDLPGWPFGPHYISDLHGFDGMRLHYVDEGDGKAGTFLCLHGQPTWSYLYRKMIPVFANEGGRVLAPDLFGFGRSDKPVDESVYSFSFHRETLVRFIERLDLRNITLVCQDWGGLLGLTLPMEMPHRFARILVMNTTLGTGDEPLGDGFLSWRAYSNRTPDMDVGALMKRSTPGLSDAEAAAYVAPFPDARYKAGVRRFPNLVPDRIDADGAELSRQARDWWTTWEGPAFMAIGMRDPVFGFPVMEKLRSALRGCPPPLQISDGGHFLQESGDVVSRAALAAFRGQEMERNASLKDAT